MWRRLCVALLGVAASAQQLPNFVSIFTTGRKMQKIEKVAVASWLQFIPGPRLLVFVDKEIFCTEWRAEAPGLICHVMEDDCMHALYHKPYMSCVFQLAPRITGAEWLMFINTDIVLSPRAPLFSMNWTALSAQRGERLFFVGVRNDVLRSGHLPNEASLADVMALNASRHAPTGMDYFLYRPQDLPIPMPPFLVGLWLWDSWLMMYVLRNKSIKVVDASELLDIRHVGNVAVFPHSKRIGATYNRRVYTPTLTFCKWECTLELARITSADYRLDVTEVGPQLLPVNPGLVLHAWRRSNDEGQIVVLAVNSAQLPLFRNWRCYAARIQITNYLVLAGDKKAYQQLWAMGEPVIPLDPELGDDLDEDEIDHGTLAFQRLLLQRMQLVMKLLKFGFWPVVMDVDTLPFEDPQPYFRRSCNLQSRFPTTDPKPDPAAKAQGVQISGGLVGISPDRIGFRFWKQVTGCQQANVKALQDFDEIPEDFYAAHTDQACIEKITGQKQSLLNVCVLPPLRFVDGVSFYTNMTPQFSGYFPVVIHNDGVTGMAAKVQRMKEWDLWLLNDQQQCNVSQADHDAPAAPAHWSALKLRMKIRVITFNRGQSLLRLLNSLQAASYGQDQVELEVLIDRAVEETPEWKDTIGIAEKFQWSHGPKKVVVQSQNVGVVGQWLHDPGLEDDGHLLLVLEDDLMVSPVFYQYLKRAAEVYYLDPNAYDPRLYGISLQKQHAILGERKKRRYGSQKIEALLDPSTQVYLYQAVGCWGQLLFPRPWARFRAWFQQVLPARRAGTFQPCVPGLITNFYFIRGGGKDAWTTYFVYWVFYEGVYNLYFNVNGSLVTNFREKGLHFTAGQKVDLGPPLIDDPTPLPLPPRAQVPLYDYYFEPVKHPETLLLRTRIYSKVPSGNHCFSFAK